jgi:glycosyltransferase involved in cell wall biosynthesis
MIESRGLADRVGLTGFVDSAAAMRALDVVVHSSTEPEPFGLAIAEAMACGRAVITTASGGAAELVTDGRDAVIAPAANVRALTEAFMRLAHDPELRRAMGDRARVTAETRFNAGRMASQIAQAFEAIHTAPTIAQSA